MCRLPVSSHRSGFSIIEMLIYIGIVSVFLVVLGGLFVSILTAQLDAQSTSSIDQDNRYIQARMAYDIHRADNILTPAALGTPASSFSLDIGGVTYTYSIINNQLNLTASGNTQSLTSYASQVSGFTVTRLGNVAGKQSLQISYTLTSLVSTLNQTSQVRNVTTTVAVR